MPCTGAVFGDRAIELSGIVVNPQAQAHGLGLEMLQSYLKPGHDAAFITAYSRNPAVFRLFEKHHHASYPKHQTDAELASIAAEMPNATIVNNVTYHINRYGADGLYGNNDPAERIDKTTGRPYKETYPLLDDPGTALVLAARIQPGAHQSNFAIIKQRSPRS